MGKVYPKGYETVKEELKKSTTECRVNVFSCQPARATECGQFQFNCFRILTNRRTFRCTGDSEPCPTTHPHSQGVETTRRTLRTLRVLGARGEVLTAIPQLSGETRTEEQIFYLVNKDVESLPPALLQSARGS